MRVLKVSLIFIISICFLGCPFDENREVEKKLTESVNKFHNLFNQEKFDQIYTEASDELKDKTTRHKFILYLNKLKEDDRGEIAEISKVWLDDEIKDAIKKIWVKKTKFSHVELVETDNAIYTERFEWNLSDELPKLVSFDRKRICNKPCQLDFKKK